MPIVPPTPERVRRALQATDRDPSAVIGGIAPKFGEATVEKIAINAVMAGCGPEHLPVVITAVEAMLEKKKDRRQEGRRSAAGGKEVHQQEGKGRLRLIQRKAPRSARAYSVRCRVTISNASSTESVR